MESIKYYNFQDIIDKIPIGIFESDLKGKYIYVNKTLAKIYGYFSTKELINSNIDIFSHLHIDLREKQKFLSLISSRGNIAYKTQALRKDGSKIWVYVNIYPIKDDRGKIISYKGFVIDITEQKSIKEALEKSEERFYQIMHASKDAIALLDTRTYRFVEWNETAVKMFGFSSKEEIINAHPFDLSPPKQPDGRDSYEKAIEMINIALEKGFHQFEWVHKRIDGELFYVKVSLILIIYKNKIYLYCTWQDISEQKRLERELDEMEKYKILFEISPEAIAIVDEEGTFLTLNSSMAKLFNTSPKELKGKKFNEVMPQELAKSRIEVGKRAIKENRLITVEEAEEGRYFQVHYLPFLSSSKKNFVIIIRDITYQKQYEKKLTHLSLYDPLTKLYNRLYLEKKLNQLNKNPVYYPITIISMDIDGFKLINDILGHLEGDRYLKTCATILKTSFRSTDVITRSGGDEFVVILPNTHLKDAENIVLRLRHNLNKYNEEHKNEIPLILSIGLACAEESSVDLRELYKESDDLMYKDKIQRKKYIYTLMLETLKRILRDYNYFIYGDPERLKIWCIKLARKLNLTSQEMSRLLLLVEVHDIGKIGIPERILFKPGKLTDKEWAIIRKHPEKGYRIALAIPHLSNIADLILKHHEQWNGKGYPLKLKGKDIPIECRILAIIKAFNIMISNTPYKKAYSIEQAKEELRKNAGTQFDPKLVDLFLKILAEEGL